MRTFTFVFVLAVACTCAAGQYPIGAVAFNWTGSSGASAGPFCWESNFNCTPYTVNVTAGEQVTLTIRGQANAPYAIGISGGAGQCIAFPGIQGNLMLDPGAILVGGGALGQVSGILACPAWFDQVVATFPSTFPIGSTVAVQVYTFGEGNVPSFPRAIVATVN